MKTFTCKSSVNLLPSEIDLLLKDVRPLKNILIGDIDEGAVWIA